MTGLEGATDVTRNKQIVFSERQISTQTQWRLFTLILLINDFVMLGIAFRLAYLIRFELELPFFQLDVEYELPYYSLVVMIFIPIWLFLFFVMGLYKRQNLLGGIQEYSFLFRGTTIGLLLVVVVGFLEPTFIIARGWLLLAWFLAFLLTATGRFWLRRVVYSLRKKGYFLSPALIIGANDEASSLAEQLVSWVTSGLHVVGVVDDTLEPGTRFFHDLRVLGKIDAVDELINKYQIEELILAHSALSREDVTNIFKLYGFSDKVNLRLSSGLFELITTGLEVKEFAYVPLVKVHKVKLTGVNYLLKLFIDYGVAIPSLIFSLPLMILIAVAIKLDSPGPVIYRRRVMGVNGRQFDAYKFRTMHINGGELLATQPELVERLKKHHKLKEDPRITRVGRLIRSSSLDELPQLFNVLKFQMSLVGPRMISPPEMEMYNHWALNLLTVRPGITGLWQVSGRSDLAYEDRVRLDMYYIRNWTFWLDLHLLLRTLPAIVKRSGAY